MCLHACCHSELLIRHDKTGVPGERRLLCCCSLQMLLRSSQHAVAASMVADAAMALQLQLMRNEMRTVEQEVSPCGTPQGSAWGATIPIIQLSSRKPLTVTFPCAGNHTMQYGVTPCQTKSVSVVTTSNNASDGDTRPNAAVDNHPVAMPNSSV